MRELIRQLRQYHKTSKFVSPEARPWNRAQVQWAFLRRGSYVAWPLYGHVLAALREGRLEIEPGVTLLPGCWLSMPGEARLRLGHNVWVAGNVMLHAYHRIEIGEFSGIGRGSFISDAIHLFDDRGKAAIWQGMKVKGPTIIGSHVAIMNNVAVMGGITIGDRAIVATNSVVTHDVEPETIVGGIPAKVIKRVEFRSDGGVPAS